MTVSEFRVIHPFTPDDDEKMYSAAQVDDVIEAYAQEKNEQLRSVIKAIAEEEDYNIAVQFLDNNPKPSNNNSD